jgi:hypothetical protein
VHACTAALQHPSFVAVALVLFALLPRVVATGRFVTVDEGYHWFARAGQFLRAVRAHEWGATTIIGYPGVTTLWLGAGGQALYEALARAGRLRHRHAGLQRSGAGGDGLGDAPHLSDVGAAQHRRDDAVGREPDDLGVLRPAGRPADRR